MKGKDDVVFGMRELTASEVGFISGVECSVAERVSGGWGWGWLRSAASWAFNHVRVHFNPFRIKFNWTWNF